MKYQGELAKCIHFNGVGGMGGLVTSGFFSIYFTVTGVEILFVLSGSNFIMSGLHCSLINLDLDHCTIQDV